MTWEEVDGVKTVKARLAAKGYQDPALREGDVDAVGCVSRRSSHLHLVFPGDLEEWPLRSLDVKNAFPQADGFGREVPFAPHASGIPTILAAFGH